MNFRSDRNSKKTYTCKDLSLDLKYWAPKTKKHLLIEITIQLLCLTNPSIPYSKAEPVIPAALCTKDALSVLFHKYLNSISNLLPFTFIFFKSTIKLKQFFHLNFEEEMQDAPLRQAQIMTLSGHFFKVLVVVALRLKKKIKNEFAFIYFALLRWQRMDVLGTTTGSYSPVSSLI